jgi:Inorganic Pyrophosphatase
MPSWVKDKNKWEDAKQIANYEYDLDEDDPKYWKIVTGIYKKMGGAIQGAEQKMTKSIMLFFRKAEPVAVYQASHEPTQAQIEAGNYKKRKIKWNGLTISIENPAGSVRRGVDRDGHAWETRMLYDYGYINLSNGADDEHVDCYVGPYPDAPYVYIVHQRKAGDWKAYDEDKCMLSFASRDEAIATYLKHYDDPRFLGTVTEMSILDFKKKVLASNGTIIKAFLFFKPCDRSSNK